MSNSIKTGTTEKKSATKVAPAKSVAKKTTTAASPRKPVRKNPAPAGNIASRDSATIVVTAEDREKMIAQAAYLRAEQRGFMGGDPVQDWLTAEAEVDALLSQSSH